MYSLKNYKITEVIKCLYYVKRHNRENNLNLELDEMIGYVKIIILLNKMSNDKLDYDILIKTFELFKEIANNQRPDINVFKLHGQIKGLYRYFEVYAPTRGILDDIEKEQLAFTIYYITYLNHPYRFYAYSGQDYITYESIKEIYNDNKRESPYFFDYNIHDELLDRNTFGKTMDNYISISNNDNVYRYLNSLVYEDGSSITYERFDSDELLAEFLIGFKIYNKYHKEELIYIFPYDSCNDRIAPKGLKLRNINYENETICYY